MKKRSSLGGRRMDRIREDRHLEEYHNKKKKSKETTHKQQILILHYLGILHKYCKTTVKEGIFFSMLLNRNDKNTEDYIRDVGGKIKGNQIMTENNLEFVYNLFIELEMSELAEEVKIDVDKLKID